MLQEQCWPKIRSFNLCWGLTNTDSLQLILLSRFLRWYRDQQEKRKKGNISSTWIVFLPVLSDTLISVSVSAPGQLIHLVFCPMIVRVRKWSFHREGRKCVCQWLITVLAQQLWGGSTSMWCQCCYGDRGQGWGLKWGKGEGQVTENLW